MIDNLLGTGSFSTSRLLIGLVPLVGAIVFLVFLALDGTRGPNRHGEDPKATAPGAAYQQTP